MKIDKKKIGVVGVGMVGKQIKKWFKSKNHRVFSYDRYQKIGTLTDIDNAQIIFLCLPTPHSRKNKIGVDFSVFNETIKFFKKPKVFIIKSTVPPGATDGFQKKFKKHYFFHNPEFLTESTAWQDFSKPAMQLVGFTQKNKKTAENILKILPKAKFSKILPATEAEIFKFARNAFFAVKVIFANQIYDMCGKLGADYENLKEIMEEELKLGKERSSHFEIIHKGYRGFGGKCLPKDLKTFIKIFEAEKLNPELLKTIDKINESLLKKQKLKKTLNAQWLNNKN